MAILLYFRKVAEHGDLVRYRVGNNRDELTIDLVIDMVRLCVVPSESGTTHRLALPAVGKIARLWRDSGAWPENGVVAS